MGQHLPSFIIIFLAFILSLPFCIQPVQASGGQLEYQKNNYIEVTKRADSGDVKAQNSLGVMYETGEGTEQNYELSIKWYLQASNAGNAEAMANVARMYIQGSGVSKDVDLGLEWMKKSADSGFAAAQSYVGAFYLNNSPEKLNDQQAFNYLAKAADAGDADAQYNLGNMYFEGRYVEKNYEKAGAFFAQAISGLTNPIILDSLQRLLNQNATTCGANKDHDGEVVYDLDACFLAIATNDPRVLHAIGLAYLDGNKNVAIDRFKAVNLIASAAKKRFAPAQITLAVLYHEGTSVSQDRIESYAWFSVARTNPNLSKLQLEVAILGQDRLQDELGFLSMLKAKFKTKQYINEYGFRER